MSYEKILKDIEKKIFSPVYFLTGDEPYFIDKLTDALEQGILDPAEREFNQSTIYGSDINVENLLVLAKRFPMFADYQVIIVKEAQEIKNIEELSKYIGKPVPSTILVLAYKHKKIDKRKGFAKLLDSKAVFFESKKLYDNQIPEWITQYTQKKGYSLNPQAAMMLTDHVGSDLSRLVHEVEKLFVNLPSGTTINSVHIEQFVGISKDFNVFELQKAIGDKNIFRANQIAFYMSANPKENPILKLIPIIYSLFSKILIYHSLADKSKTAVASALGINPFFVQDYQKAAGNFSSAKVVSVISILRQYDLKAKGVNNESTEQSELVREMIYK
ncbi:MAG: DNA polymerase III subunit delta, partial [Bacteroidetes bacterium]|nr:DNA polymerase III subunit delta [Bacteroidota bacterium]